MLKLVEIVSEFFRQLIIQSCYWTTTDSLTEPWVIFLLCLIQN